MEKRGVIDQDTPLEHEDAQKAASVVNKPTVEELDDDFRKRAAAAASEQLDK